MKKLQNFLFIDEKNINIKYFILLTFIAFMFSLSIRYIWVDMFNNVDAFKWNNQLMINTNDGYFYAEGARDIVNGFHQENDLSPIETPLAKLTALLAQILPISFETLILWMPGVFGSLLVVPIMLIARILKQDILGFCAALLGGIALSYYNRTMIGYYDTDLLVVVLPTFMVWGALYALKNEDSDAFIFAPLFAIAALHWHTGMLHIANGLFIITLFYTIIFERKNLYYYKFLATFVVVLTSLSILIKFITIIALIAIFHIFKDKLTDKIVITLVIVSALMYLAFGGFEWIMSILQSSYITRLVASELDLNSLKFFGVVNTVREAGHIPFETFANRISGHTITFILSTIGYFLLLIRYRILLLTLPMVALGFFAIQGGLRFTVFAIPFTSLGVIYLIFLLAKYLEILFNNKIKVFAKYLFIFSCTIGVLYPNIKHIQNYKVPTVFQKNEVSVLNKLKNIASREDYVLTWWDYGYPIRYYSDVKTLIDGGKHDGKSNFSVAFALTNNQVAAANMARLDVEFTELGFKNRCGASIECILKAYKVKDPDNFFDTLNDKNLKKPAKTRDVYFYLPNRMLSIFPTVDLFSNLDILTGQNKAKPFFYVSKGFQDNGVTINLGNNIILNKKDGTVQIGNYKTALNYFAITQYDNTGKLRKNIQQIDKSSKVSVIFMKNYKQFLVLDNRMFNSSFIQLFALENYDKDLFEPVILTPLAKVYKLKI